MRFMMMVSATKDSEAGKMPPQELMERIGKDAERLMKEGVMLMSAGLAPTSAASKVEARGGKLTVTDGPFAEATETIGGFAIIEAKDKAEAVEHGRRFMQIHIEVLGPGYTGAVTVRPLFSADQMGPPKR